MDLIMSYLHLFHLSFQCIRSVFAYYVLLKLQSYFDHGLIYNLMLQIPVNSNLLILFSPVFFMARYIGFDWKILYTNYLPVDLAESMDSICQLRNQDFFNI